MRTLKFIVDGQVIKQDPRCNFNDLVPGTEGYLAEFSFSSEWNGAPKVIAFWSSLGKEYSPQVLKDGKTCVIPTEALAHRVFKVQVLGKKDGRKLITNKVVINQNGGKA